MIVTTDIANILYKDCKAFGIEVYQAGNIPDEHKELSSEMVIIRTKSQSPETYWKKGFVEVNLCVPDMDGDANLIRLQELERKAQEVLDEVVGEYDGSNYYYLIDSIGITAAGVGPICPL